MNEHEPDDDPEIDIRMDTDADLETVESACTPFRRLLSLEIDAEAAPDQLRELEGHLAICDPCATARLVDQAVRELFDGRSELPASLNLAGKLELGLRTAAKALPSLDAYRARRRFLAQAAAAAVIAAAGVGLWSSGRSNAVPQPGGETPMAERTQVAVIVPALVNRR